MTGLLASGVPTMQHKYDFYQKVFLGIYDVRSVVIGIYQALEYGLELFSDNLETAEKVFRISLDFYLRLPDLLGVLVTGNETIGSHSLADKLEWTELTSAFLFDIRGPAASILSMGLRISTTTLRPLARRLRWLLSPVPNLCH